MKISEQLKALRTKGKLSQSELSEKAGILPSAVSRLESPNYFGHTIKSIRRFASALGFDVVIKFVRRK